MVCGVHFADRTRVQTLNTKYPRPFPVQKPHTVSVNIIKHLSRFDIMQATAAAWDMNGGVEGMSTSFRGTSRQALHQASSLMAVGSTVSVDGSEFNIEFASPS